MLLRGRFIAIEAAEAVEEARKKPRRSMTVAHLVTHQSPTQTVLEAVSGIKAVSMASKQAKRKAKAVWCLDSACFAS